MLNFDVSLSDRKKKHLRLTFTCVCCLECGKLREYLQVYVIMALYCILSPIVLGLHRIQEDGCIHFHLEPIKQAELANSL